MSSLRVNSQVSSWVFSLLGLTSLINLLCLHLSVLTQRPGELPAAITTLDFPASS